MDNTLFLILIFATTVCSVVLGDNCPRNYPDTTAVYRRGEYCYQFVHKERYWTSARDYCRDRNGYLVRVDDEAVNTWLTGKLDSLWWRNSGVWIGLHDISEELEWMWVTSDKYLQSRMGSWNNWASGHPGAFWHTSRDCVRMVRSDNWKWHETFCSALNWKYRFICQYKIPEASMADTGMQLGATTTTPAHTTSAVQTTNGREQSTEEVVMFGGNERAPGGTPDTDTKTTEEELYYEYSMENRELPIPLAQISEEEKQKDGGIVGGVMTGLVVIIIVLVVLLLLIRRKREKNIEQDAELSYPVEKITPAKDLTVMCSTPDEQDYRMSNIYVEAPEPDLLSNPLPPTPLSPTLPPANPRPPTLPPMNNPNYEEVNDARPPKVTVLERSDLENGGSKVKVMISRGKGSSVSYVLPDQVGARCEERPDLSKVEVGKEGIKEGEDEETNGYLCMDGSPRNAAKQSANPRAAQRSHDDEIDGYERPTSPFKSRPIRALPCDANEPIRVQDGADDVPYANEGAAAQSVSYDVPRPEPIYAEIPENIYEDLDEHQARMKESTA